jgi:GNAT superfamily N-acetyltransferase
LIVQSLPASDLQNALDLVLRVFMQFEAPEYPPEGVETFRAFLKNPEAISALHLFGAYEGGSLVGVLATRGEDGSHIALFFVETVWQGRGVGRALFAAAYERCQGGRMTVNASPYAKAIYERLGFTAVTGEQLTDGIRFIPMVCEITRPAR